MATVTTTTQNARVTFNIKNGKTRYIDIEDPTTNTAVITSIATGLDNSIKAGGTAEGVLVADGFFDGDSDAVVIGVASVQYIEVQKTTTTNVMWAS